MIENATNDGFNRFRYLILGEEGFQQGLMAIGRDRGWILKKTFRIQPLSASDGHQPLLETLFGQNPAEIE